MSIWDSLGNTQETFSNIAVPGKKNDRVPFGTALDISRNLPKNPGGWNDRLEAGRTTSLEIASGLASPVLSNTIGRADKATGGKISEVLMAGTKSVRSNYAFLRAEENNNVGMSLLAGLGMLAGGVGGALAGSVLGPAGAVAGFSLGMAMAGKVERTGAKAIGGSLGAAAKEAETAKGQEKYNFGRDVVTAASKITGWEAIGDTSKGLGAVTSGLLNFGAEMAVTPDIAAGKLAGAAVRRTTVGAINETGSKIAGKVFESKFQAQTKARLENDIDLINRTVAGETTAYTPLFQFLEANNAATIINRAGFGDELGNTAAHLLAGQSRDRIGLVLRAGRGDKVAIEELAAQHADLYAKIKRYDSDLKTVEQGGISVTVFQDRNIVVGPQEALKQNVDLIKNEIDSLIPQKKWLEDSLKLDSTMQDRTVARWAWVEKVRNDVAKERLARKLEQGPVTNLETGVGKTIQTFYQSGPFGTLVRMVDRAVDDSPKNSINFNDPIQMPDRFRANIRSAIRHGDLLPEEGLNWYNRLINSGNEVDKFAIVKEYTDAIGTQLAKKHGVSDGILSEVLKAYDAAHRTLLEQARTARLDERGYMIDVASGEVLHDPVLVTQLANGAYLPDVKLWDKAFERYSKKYGAAASKMESYGATASLIADEFNSLWRGFTLLRGGYPMNIIRDTSVRAYGDGGVLFDMLKVVSQDAIESIANSSASIRKLASAVDGAISGKASVSKIRSGINDRVAYSNILRKKLEEAKYDFENPPTKVTQAVKDTLDSYNEINRNIAELRRQEQHLLSGKQESVVGRDKMVNMYGYQVNAPFSGRLADISRQQLSQADDLKRALGSAKQLEVENVRRSRTGVEPIIATEREAEHLVAWEEVLKDQLGFDVVARQIMEGKTRIEVIRWLQDPANSSYLERLGRRPSDVREVYKNVEALVDSYAPSAELRKLILDNKVNTDELRRLYPDVAARPVILSDLVKDTLGTSNAYVKFRDTVKNGVAWLSTQPTSKLMFSPYFAVKYNTKYQSLIYNANLQGRKLTQKELDHFEVVSRSFAIREYKEKLNSFHRDMNYNGMVNYLLAFFPAVIEQYRAYGRIAAEHPDFLIKAAQISYLPQRIGAEKQDANGDKYVEVSLPLIGGTKARIYSNWFNVFNPTGSSIISASPYLSYATNEVAKRYDIEGKFTEWALPFGSQANAAGFVTPNTVRRLTQAAVASFKRNGDQFNRDVNMFLNDERVKYVQDKGVQPNGAELTRLTNIAEERAIAMSWLRFASSVSLPTQPKYTTGLQAYADELNKLRQSGIPNADEVFIEKYPDYFLLTSRMSDATSGINPDRTAAALVKKNPETVKRLAAEVGVDGINVLGAVFNDADYAFSSSAQAYLESTKIPGTNKKFRDVAGYLDTARQSIVSKGWDDLTNLKKIVREELTKAEINPNTGYGKAILKQYKDAFIEDQRANNKIWWDEYQSGFAGSKRTENVVKALSISANTPKLWADLRKRPEWSDIVNYLNFRYDVYDELKRRKTTIDSKKAVDIAERVDAYVADLSKNPHFAKLYTRYFENDKFDYVYEEN